MALRTVLFPAITRNGFCLHIRKIISRRPWTPPKNRDIHIAEFFVDSFVGSVLAEPPDNGAILQIIYSRIPG